MKTSRIRVLPLFALAAFAAGCGGSSASSSTSSTTTGSTVSSLAASKRGTSLQLTALAQGLAFDKKTLTARPGLVRITMTNRSALQHNVSLKGNGVNVKGPIAGLGRTSTITATLKPGVYEFYCSVDGHAAAGMKGTLRVR